MDRFEFMHGTWVGTASGYSPEGPFELVQTERVGPMLGGDVMLIEGRGYEDDGTLSFNALGIVSYNQYADKYEMRSYAQGRAGTFEIKPTDDGFEWAIPAGPEAQMQYSARFDGDSWEQVGSYVKEGEEPRETFRMSLTRTGDTDWPEAGAVTP